MTCFHPIAAWRSPAGVVFHSGGRTFDRFDLPCGQCSGCRAKRARDWSLRCMHEASLWPENCFVTLTYGRNALPPDSSLEYRDFQLFMKRLRKFFFPRLVRFFCCGEYGPLNLRPHFHACLFNCSFSDSVVRGKSGAGAVFFRSPTLDDLWSFGSCSVQPLTIGTAAYCAKYIVGKVTGDAAESHYSRVDEDGVIHRRVPEFAHMSLRPGIGAGWLERFRGDVFPHDFVVADGVKFSPPKFYDRLLKRSDECVRLDVAGARQARAKLSFADNSDERLRVREEVHKARVRNQRRVFDG
ncbi:MAG: replication initiator protein [Microvirus sp.]|nr:MAG: replication initiator protein [Microvirus sp.]